MKGAWSVATTPSTPPASAAFSRRWCSGLRMGGLITYCAATCERNLSYSLCLVAYTGTGVYVCDRHVVVGGDHARFAARKRRLQAPLVLQASHAHAHHELRCSAPAAEYLRMVLTA